MLKIYVPEERGIFKIAAEEFISFYSRMTGEKPSITTADDGKSDMVVLGSDAVNAFTHSKIIEKVLPDLRIPAGSDAYKILSVADHGRTLLFLAGGRNRAILYALYHFFELQGCRYFWDGDIVPEKKTIDISSCCIEETPRFQYRGLRYFAHRSLKRFQAEHWDIDDWKKELDYCLKKRFNLYMLRIGMDDLFQKAFPDIVSYPKWKVPESRKRSYDDRDLFWSLEYRGELRKMVLAYGRERDLFHPEDLGTMTHWYSRTPHEFLNAVKPDFMPQTTAGYGDPTGLVWDIRKEENLDNYFHLTETHIREYGEGKLFHTIGLAERRCYADRAANHQMKLYTYRRIIQKLREKYPDNPLLIASWDFCMYWKPEEVRDFLAELDKDNTILLEYTSETDDEANNFMNWDVVGRFPWIFGIFHAFEPNNDVRGHYDIIERRLSVAARDNMCKGMILWPECSHTDTLMLEYLGANSWNPSDDNRSIASFLPRFVKDRYGEEERKIMGEIWEKFLPVIKMRGFVGPQQSHAFLIGEHAFNLRTYIYNGSDLSSDPRPLFYQKEFLRIFSDAFKVMPGLLRDLAKIDYSSSSSFLKRDMIDIARSIVGRLILGGICKFSLEYDAFRKGDGTREKLIHLYQILDKVYPLLTDLLDVHEDYSLYDSLRELQEKHECNPDFEQTLKGNAENGYCRSYMSELARAVYHKEFRICFAPFMEKIVKGDTSILLLQDDENTKIAYEKMIDEFYAMPLAELAPDHGKAVEKLPATLEALAKAAEEFISEEANKEEVNAFLEAAQL